MILQQYANPARFSRLADRLMPFLAWPAALLLAAGLYFGLFNSPPDYQQGDTVRIMYIHVPAAIMAESVFIMMGVASAVGLIWRHPLAHLSAQAAAPLGAGFTFLCLFSGSLWGKPMWGTWWVWDARLTSVLILFFLYLGFIALKDAFDDPARGEKAAAILALVGSINVPIIKFSVEWWNTLHQPPSLGVTKVAIHSSILLPLMLMAAGFCFYFGAVLLIRMKSLMLARRARGMAMARAAGEPGAGREAQV